VEVRGAPSSGVAAAPTSPTLTTTPAATTAKAPVKAAAKAPAKATPKAPVKVAKKAPAKVMPKAPAKTPAATVKKPAAPVHHTTTVAPVHHTTTAAAPKPAKPHAVAAQKPTPAVAATPTSGTVPFSERPPAFLLAGNAHRERAGELPLPVRADKLMRYVHAHAKPTDKVVKHWLVQHAWITAGARFGWWHGAQALQTLIATDRLVEAEWGIGYRSEALARAALAYVHAHEVNR
jgi:hypothetical protein